MLSGGLANNNRILSLAIFIVTLCGGGNIWCLADELWNSTVSEATVKFVRELAASVDSSRRPCDDFYGYICGRKDSAQLFPSRPSEEELFQKFITHEDEDQLLDVELNLKRFYESCTAARGVEQLKSSHLYRVSGGWPAIEGEAGKRRDAPSWVHVLASFHDLGLDYFFKHRVDIQSNKRHVYLEANLDVKYSLRKNIQMGEELLLSYGVEPVEARLVALDFGGLEGSRRDVAKNASASPSTMTYGDFKAKYATVDWDAYFRRLLSKPPKDTDTLHLQDEKKLEGMIVVLAQTPVTRLLNYLWIDYHLEKATGDCVQLVRQYLKPVYRHIVERSSIDKRGIVKVFSDIGSVYKSLLFESVWIDEISNEKSKLYMSRIIHTTLNGDTRLDSDYVGLTMTRKNFYRNLEKCHRMAQHTVRRNLAASSVSLTDLYEFFMGPMYRELLVEPLYYGSIGEAFAEKMIEGGSSASAVGSWRSSDSDEKFAEFERCLQMQSPNFPPSNSVSNNLVRRMLAERQTFNALQNWIKGNADAVRRIGELLSSVDPGLSLEKLYFYTSVHTHCAEGQAFVNTYLKNTPDFSEAFACPVGAALKQSRTCDVL